MPQTNEHIALLLFTRSPDEEVQYKSLVPDNSLVKQKAAVSKLIQESRQVLVKTGLPYFICSSSQQVGETFADRLYAAFAGLFAQGFRQVIAIGNDCPQLKSLDILKAAACLQQQDVVVGPDTSGGVYLFGLSYSAFLSCTSFSGIRWSTSQVQDDIASLFRIPAADLAVLPAYADLDNYSDLVNALYRKYFRIPLIIFFNNLLNFNRCFKSIKQICLVPAFHYSNLHFRGPPTR